MLKVEPSLRQVRARAEQIVILLESANLPLVNIPSIGTSQTRAYVLGLSHGPGVFSVYVFLLQEETGAFLVYVSEPSQLNAQQYAVEETEALRFVQSMGFEMSDYGFRTLSGQGQYAVMAQLPIFDQESVSPPTVDVPTLELTEEVSVPGGSGPSSLFGGLDSHQAEAFRRAGVMPSVGTPPPTVRGTIPGTIQGTPQAPPPKSIPGEPGLVFASGGEDPPEPGAAENTESLDRLGRLLSTFCLLAILGNGCAHTVPQGAELPDAVRTKLDIGLEELSQGRQADAIKTLTGVLEEAPYAKEALHALGVAHLQLGKEDVGEDYLRRAVESDPKWSIAKNTYASLLIQHKRCEEAVVLLQQVLQDIYYPTPDFAEHNLALAERCLNKPDVAIARLQKLVTRRPQFCLGYLTLADMTWEAKKPESTIDACEAFRAQCEENEKVKSAVSPEHACMCYLRKGLAYADLGDVESARESFMSCHSEGAYGRQCQQSLDMLPE